MNNISTHPHYEYLQERLDELKKRLVAKREEAIKLFTQILEQYKVTEVGTQIPSHVQEQLQYMEEMLNLTGIEAGQQIEYENIEELCARLAIDDVLQALQTLSTPEDQKSMILVEKFKEDLKKQVVARLAQQDQILSEQTHWKNQVRAKDMITTLHQSPYLSATQSYGGPIKMLEQAIKLAENFANMLGNISDKEFTPAQLDAQIAAEKNVSQGR